MPRQAGRVIEEIIVGRELRDITGIIIQDDQIGSSIDLRYDLATALANELLHVAARHAGKPAYNCDALALEHLRTRFLGLNAHSELSSIPSRKPSADIARRSAAAANR